MFKLIQIRDGSIRRLKRELRNSYFTREGALMLEGCDDEMSKVHLQCAFTHFDKTIHYSPLLVVDEDTGADNCLPVSSVSCDIFPFVMASRPAIWKILFFRFLLDAKPKKGRCGDKKKRRYLPMFVHYGWTIQGLSVQRCTTTVKA